MCVWGFFTVFLIILQPSTAEAFGTVAGTEIKYLIQKGKVENCFELRGGPEELCCSSRWTSVCNISSTHIKWRRDTELNCFYNSTDVILKGEPAIDQNSISFERENISGISFDQQNIAVSPPKTETKSSNGTTAVLGATLSILSLVIVMVVIALIWKRSGRALPCVTPVRNEESVNVPMKQPPLD